jgi:hypothetical protein
MASAGFIRKSIGILAGITAGLACANFTVIAASPAGTTGCKAAFVPGFRGRSCRRVSAVEVIITSPAASDSSRFVTAELVPCDGELVKRRGRTRRHSPVAKTAIGADFTPTRSHRRSLPLPSIETKDVFPTFVDSTGLHSRSI